MSDKKPAIFEKKTDYRFLFFSDRKWSKYSRKALIGAALIATFFTWAVHGVVHKNFESKVKIIFIITYNIIYKRWVRKQVVA